MLYEDIMKFIDNNLLSNYDDYCKEATQKCLNDDDCKQYCRNYNICQAISSLQSVASNVQSSLYSFDD